MKLQQAKNGILLGIFAWTFSTLLAGNASVAEGEEARNDYTKGVFIVNEDWFGHQNSTVNWISERGEWTYRAFQKANPGRELGATTQYGAIYGDKFYFVSKQEKDPGATVVGGRLTVCEAKTLKCLKQIPSISTDKNGKSNADGRSFLGVDTHKAYISTNNGIYVYDIDKMEIHGQIKDTGNPNTDPYGSFYKGQIGNMVRVNEYVFAVHQSAGILVIDAQKDSLIHTIQAPLERDTLRGYGSVVLSKDGSLWASVARNQSGSGTAVPYILRVDPISWDTLRFNMPKDITSPGNSWYAWTPDGFCAGTKTNCLYWNGGSDSWFGGMKIIKYDIDENRFETIVDLTNTDWKVYGASLRINPMTDELYTSLYHDVQDPTYVLRKYSNTGALLAEYPMITNYWFPSLPLFPDNEAPAVTVLDRVLVDHSDPMLISLSGVATDADNMQAAIVKNVVRVSDEDILTASIVNGNLRIIPRGENGDAEVTVAYNSNGKVTESLVSVSVNVVSGMEENGIVLRCAYSRDKRLFVNNCEGFNCVLYTVDGASMTSFSIDNADFSIPLNFPSGIYLLKGIRGTETFVWKLQVQ